MEITNYDIRPFLLTIDEKKRQDIFHLVALFTKLTQETPKLWGSIIGFGRLRYVYGSGHSGEMPLIGLASRKQGLTLYLSNDITKFENLHTLGKYKHGKGCLYINRLEDIDLEVLKVLTEEAMKDTLSLAFITKL